MRVCKICNEEKELNQFKSGLKNGKVYHLWTCKPCQNDARINENEASRKLREKNQAFNQVAGWPKPCQLK